MRTGTDPDLIASHYLSAPLGQTRLDHAMTDSKAISLSRLLTRLESSLGDPDKLSVYNQVELRKAAAVSALQSVNVEYR